MRAQGISWIQDNVEMLLFYNTIERTTTYEADVPSYPTEKGVEVSDTVVKKPMTLTAKGRLRDETDVKRIQRMYTRGSICMYTSPSFEHENVVIERLSIKESSEVGNEWEVELGLKQVWTTAAEIVELDDTPQNDGNNSGAADTQDVATETKQYMDFCETVEKANKGLLVLNVVSSLGNPATLPIAAISAISAWGTDKLFGEKLEDLRREQYEKIVKNEDGAADDLAKSMYTVKNQGNVFTWASAGFAAKVAKIFGIGQEASK